jgi:hypothetical protein
MLADLIMVDNWPSWPPSAGVSPRAQHGTVKRGSSFGRRCGSGLLLCRLCSSRDAVVAREVLHLAGRQLHRDRPHLLIDVVLPHALREGCELALDIGGVLPRNGGAPRFWAPGP